MSPAGAANRHRQSSGKSLPFPIRGLGKHGPRTEGSVAVLLPASPAPQASGNHLPQAHASPGSSPSPACREPTAWVPHAPPGRATGGGGCRHSSPHPVGQTDRRLRAPSGHCQGFQCGGGGRLQTIFDKCVKSIQRRKSSLCDKGGRAITHPQTANKQVKMGRKKRKRKEKKKKKKRKRKKERTLTLTSHLTTNGSWI